MVLGIGQSENRQGEKCIETHQIMIFDRGGVRRLWQLADVSTVRWTRELEKTSTAEIIVSGEACVTQGDILGQIEPRRHEMVIFRNGERVWEGPIVDVAWYRDRVRIVAHDVSEYLRYTMMSRRWPNYDWGGTPFMMNRVWQIINYELTQPYTVEVGTGDAAHDIEIPRWENIDPPANILPFLEVRQGGILTRSSTEAFELTVMEHLENLARGGMDWTVIGRKMLFWDRAYSIGQTRILTDNDFYGDIEVYASGSDHWSISHATAEPSEGEDQGVTPSALRIRPHAIGDQVLEVRTNLMIDPRAKILHGVDFNPWSSDSHHTVIDVVDEDGTTWVKAERVSTGTSRALSMSAEVQTSTEYRVQFRVRASEQTTLAIAVRAVLTSAASGSTVAEVTVPVGESRVDVTGSYTYQRPADATSPRGVTINRSDGAIGSSFEVTEIVIEEAPGGPYFDGTFANNDRQTYAWTGAVDDSTSTETTQATIPPEGWYNSRANLFYDPRVANLDPHDWNPGQAGTLARFQETGEDGVADGPWYMRFTYTGDGNLADGPYLLAGDMYPNVENRLRVVVNVPENKKFPNLGLVLRGDVNSTDGQSEIFSKPLDGDGEWVIDVKGTYTTADDQLGANAGWVFVWDAGGFENYDMKDRYIDIREILIEELPSLGDRHGYFDGSFPSTPNNLYAWYGEVDRGISIEQSLKPTGNENALAVGSAGGPDPYYGVWTHLVTMSNEEGTTSISDNELTTQAQRDLVGRTPVPIEIRVPSGGGIKPSFDLRIEDLVPGVIAPVRATLNLRPVVQNQRVDSVTVQEDASREEVGLGLTPWGDVTGVST